MSAKITITGLEEVMKDLQQYPSRVQKRILRQGLRQGAEVYRIGVVQNAMGIDRKKSKNKIWRNVKNKPAIKRSRQTGNVIQSVTIQKTASGGDTFYWYMVEFGSSHAAAHPFMRPAYESLTDAAIREVADEMRARLNKKLT